MDCPRLEPGGTRSEPFAAAKCAHRSGSRTRTSLRACRARARFCHYTDNLRVFVTNRHVMIQVHVVPPIGRNGADHDKGRPPLSIDPHSRREAVAESPLSGDIHAIYFALITVLLLRDDVRFANLFHDRVALLARLKCRHVHARCRRTPNPRWWSCGRRCRASSQQTQCNQQPRFQWHASPQCANNFTVRAHEHIGAQALSVPSPYLRRGRGRGYTPPPLMHLLPSATAFRKNPGNYSRFEPGSKLHKPKLPTYGRI